MATVDTLSGPVRPSNRYGECLDTLHHYRLEMAANKLLAKAGFFETEVVQHLEYFEDLFGEADYIPMPAEACGVHGLRPTWHGKAA